jgi:hypothetical protein
MTAMTQTNHAIHLSRIRGVSASCLSSLRPGDGKRYLDRDLAFYWLERLATVAMIYKHENR